MSKKVKTEPKISKEDIRIIEDIHNLNMLTNSDYLQEGDIILIPERI